MCLISACRADLVGFVLGACAVYEMGLVSLNFSAADFLLIVFFKGW